VTEKNCNDKTTQPSAGHAPAYSHPNK